MRIQRRKMSVLEEEGEEAVLQLTLSGVSRLEDVAFGKAVKLRGHQWWVGVVSLLLSL